MSLIGFHKLGAFGVLRLGGADAVSFLQSQLTADLAALEPGSSRVAAWCSPQGRVMALPRVARAAEGLVAVLPRDLCGPVSAGLTRFVLRSRVTLEDASDALRVAGLSAPDPAALASLPPWPAGVVTMPLAGGRLLLVGEPVALDALSAGWRPAPDGAWQALAISRGEPEVFAATSGEWLPQMLNLDLLGAVSFRKGCYPGQEIVARTQHLGRIKRRMFRYRASGPGGLPAPGTPLYAGADKVGEVVCAGEHRGSRELLAVVNLSAAGQGLADGAGTVGCAPQPLPYAVPKAGAAS